MQQKSKKGLKYDVNLKDVTMPHNLEAEQALLGCLMLDTDIQIDVLSEIKTSDFYVSSHRYIFEAMVDLANLNQPIDFVTLSDKLENDGNLEAAGGIEYLTTLTQIMPSSANYLHYLDIVTRDGANRRLIKSASEIIVKAQYSQDKQEAISFAEKQVFDVSSSIETSDMTKISQVIPTVVNKFDTISRNKNAYKGISTGFSHLDFLLNGLHPTDFILIAARPAMGKTSFAMNIVENVALKSNKSCAVFSLEMGKEQLAQRMLCSVAQISMEDAIKGNLSKEDWGELAQARVGLSKAKIFVNDSTAITPTEMLSKCRRIKKRYGLDLVMVDYIQLMSMGGRSAENRQQEVSAISRSLKILAKELEVPVLALSQLSRGVESRTDHRPQLSDIRESGAIEQDADIVMFIHRPDYYINQMSDKEKANVQPNIAEIIVAKHRNGPLGTPKLYFRNECTKFLDTKKDENGMYHPIVEKYRYKPDEKATAGLEDIKNASIQEQPKEVVEPEEVPLDVNEEVPNYYSDETTYPNEEVSSNDYNDYEEVQDTEDYPPLTDDDVPPEDEYEYDDEKPTNVFDEELFGE